MSSPSSDRRRRNEVDRHPDTFIQALSYGCAPAHTYNHRISKDARGAHRDARCRTSRPAARGQRTKQPRWRRRRRSTRSSERGEGDGFSLGPRENTFSSRRTVATEEEKSILPPTTLSIVILVSADRHLGHHFTCCSATHKTAETKEFLQGNPAKQSVCCLSVNESPGRSLPISFGHPLRPTTHSRATNCLGP